MVEYALDFLRWWRPSRYRGVGIRGGFVLGILWAIVSGAASELGWDPIGLTVALLVSVAVGYRLERFGGAIAVAIFSLGFWWVALSSEWAWPFAAGFGFVMGLAYGAATTEQPRRA
ncbi:MAG TPA: hypothetical protein VFG68_05320 [Fimbriiglobus sp.]|nr:hypothetical protein [Fimbriiglobus sp.]